MCTSVVRGFSRILWCAVLPPMLLASGDAPMPGTRTGSIEGHVRDGSGQGIAHAQVFVVGTAFTTVTDSAGAYRLGGIPAGTVTLRAAFVGYRPTEAVGVRVRDGKVTRQDLVLEPTAVQVQELTVVGAETPPAARDEVATKQRIGGQYTDRLPVSPDNALAEAEVDIRRRSDEWNTEEYARIYDNRFLAARSNPLSTFSIDVDRAAYSNMRRFLTAGRMPPADAVRIEELVNYFSYSPLPVRGRHPFAVETELAPAPWRDGHLLARIRLEGRRFDEGGLPPSNLVFLIDVSGSMTPPNKLPLVKQAFRMLVQQLRAEDRVAIVVYAGAAGLVLPSTPGDRKRTILDALDRLEAGGSTAGGAGIRLAYEVARQSHRRGGNNRVILATDGDFNVGVSSTSELVRLVEEKREQGTFLTVLGFGMGNYKDARMEQLADKGNGNYAYIDTPMEARKVFVTELGGTLHTIAKDVKLQLEFNPAKVRAYRLIGYENRVLAKEDFDDDTRDAGELGAGHTVTALYEIVPTGIRSDVEVQDDDLRYQTVAPSTGHHDEWLTVKLRYKEPDGTRSRLLSHRLQGKPARRGSEDFRWAAAVAAFGMVLRDSEHRGDADYDTVLRLAQGAAGEDPEGLRAEFLRLVETARGLDAGVALEDGE